MAKNTKIEWCDHSFNPWVGCAKISPGCDNCYAERWACRFGTVGWGAKANRRKTSAQNWRQPIQWNRQAEIQFSAWERFQTDNELSDDEMIEQHGFIKPRRPRVFCGSLCDVFDNAVPDEWRVELFELMSVTPHLDWLLLTKRIGNAAKMLPKDRRGDPLSWGGGWSNVWLGATICNQEEADRDIPKLLATPAAVRFVSMEPLLGPIDLAQACAKYHWTDGGGFWYSATPRLLDWTIVGGETGKHARPLHPSWVRSLRDQCQHARIPFCFKQWGEYVEWDGSQSPSPSARMDDMTPVVWVGKKSAGRLLDGRTWEEVPEC